MIDLLIRISTLYNIPQWAVNMGALAIFIILVAFPFVLKKLLEPKYYKFKEMAIYNVLWRWKYKKDDVVGLWCYCPKCGDMLACDDENCKVTEDLQHKITFFVCNACGGHEQGRVVGGDRRYALSLVKREILRQIRIGEYVNTMKLHKEVIEAFRVEKEALEALALALAIKEAGEEKEVEATQEEANIEEAEAEKEEVIVTQEEAPEQITEAIEASQEEEQKEIVQENEEPEIFAEVIEEPSLEEDVRTDAVETEADVEKKISHGV